MLVHTIPHIIVLEAIDIGIQRTVVVHVHVGHEELWVKPSMPPLPKHLV